jgi:hypothetical protein
MFFLKKIMTYHLTYKQVQQAIRDLSRIPLPISISRPVDHRQVHALLR